MINDQYDINIEKYVQIVKNNLFTFILIASIAFVSSFVGSNLLTKKYLVNLDIFLEDDNSINSAPGLMLPFGSNDQEPDSINKYKTILRSNELAENILSEIEDEALLKILRTDIRKKSIDSTKIFLEERINFDYSNNFLKFSLVHKDISNASKLLKVIARNARILISEYETKISNKKINLLLTRLNSSDIIDYKDLLYDLISEEEKKLLIAQEANSMNLLAEPYSSPKPVSPNIFLIVTFSVVFSIIITFLLILNRIIK